MGKWIDAAVKAGWTRTNAGWIRPLNTTEVASGIYLVEKDGKRFIKVPTVYAACQADGCEP